MHRPFVHTFSSILLVFLVLLNAPTISGATTAEASFDGAAAEDPSQVSWNHLIVRILNEQKDNRMIFSLPLNEDQYYEAVNVELKFLQRKENGSFEFINATQDIVYSDDDYTIYGVFKDQALFAVDEDGNRLTESLEWQWAGSNTLLIPVDLAIPMEETQKSLLREAMIYASIDTVSGLIIPEQVLFWDESTQFWAADHEIDFNNNLEIRLHHLERTTSMNQQTDVLSYNEWPVAADKIWIGETGTGWTFQMMKWPEDYERFALFEIQSSNGVWHSVLSDNVDYWPNRGESYALPDSLTGSYNDMNLLTINKFIPDIRLDHLTISASIRNISDQEMVVTMNNLYINKKPYEGFSICYGMGPNWGLLPQEEQLVGPISVPLDALQGEDTIISITFDLILEEASDGTSIATIPVTLSMVWNI